MNSPLRVALFADSFFEPNGVATLSRAFTAFAEQQQLPFLCVRLGERRRITQQGSVTMIELNRSWASFPLDKDLDCDVLLNRHRNWIIEQLKAFQPDLIHITGPGDFGVLGFWASNLIQVPLVASWHTNLHEYASKRLQGALSFLPLGLREQVCATAERLSLKALLAYYRLAHVIMAPNQEMVDHLQAGTSRPSFLMAHGVDSTRFSPACDKHRSRALCIGYVGRLTPEKNLRSFVELERSLQAAGQRNFRMLLVGDGLEREWLQANLQSGEFPGVLRGDALAQAFAEMDVFVFPSRTDTFGLVLLEAMASGVPVVVSPDTGARVEVEDGCTGFLANDFTSSVLRLMQDDGLRHRMGAEARRFACSRSWEVVFRDIYRVYHTALQREDVRCRIRRPAQANAISL